MSSLGNVIRTTSRKVYGVLAPPRVSRNQNLYLPESLMAGDGLRVPIYNDHEDFEIGRDGRPTGRILAKEARGVAQLIWNKTLQRLEYVGEVWDKGLQNLISAGKRLHVSLAAEPRRFEQYHGLKVPLDLQFFSIAAVSSPGIPEATLNMEMYMDRVAPVMLESAEGTANMILLEFDTTEMQYLSEHDFDAAIAALQAADQKLDAQKGENSDDNSQNQFDTPPDLGVPQPNFTDGHLVPNSNTHVLDAGLPPQAPPMSPPLQRPPMPQPNPMAPQGYQNLTPMRGMPPQRSGLTGVTGTGNITAMQGTGMNEPSRIPEPTPRPPVSPTGQNQQMMPRNPVQGIVDNPNAVGTGVSRDFPVNINPLQNPMQPMASTKEDDGRGDASSANPKAFGADGDMNLVHPQKVTPKGIGSSDMTVGTPFESAKLGGKGGDAGDTHNNPAKMPTMVPREDLATGEKAMDVDEEEEEVKEASNYGFSKEEFNDIKSQYTPKEWRKTWENFKLLARMSPKFRESMRRQRLESSGVTSSVSIAQQRESREGGRDVQQTSRLPDQYGVRYAMSKEDLDEHVKILSIGRQGGSMRGHEFAYYSPVPALSPPKITRNGGLGPRLEFADQLESWVENRNEQRQIALEAIATTTTGAAMAIDGAVPALIVPTNLAAMLRDTVYYQQIQQGSNTIYFQTITVPAAGALTQNTQPSDATQTLTTVSVAPTPRGVGQPISFEAERKVLGPILEAIILSFRVSELYDEDALLIGSGNAFESATLPSTATNIAGGSATGNYIYGNVGRASESLVATTDTFNFVMFSAAQAAITGQGYSPDNLVAVLHPVAYREVTTDTTYLNRILSFGPNTTPGQSWIAQGVIPEIDGFEIRRSTLMKQGVGSGSIVTYRNWAYKKGLTAGLGASRDLMIETYRNILLNNTYVKAHWDFAYAVLQPNSLVLLDTA